MIAGSSMPFLNEVLTGILDTVSVHGYSIMVYNTGEDPSKNCWRTKFCARNA